MGNADNVIKSVMRHAAKQPEFKQLQESKRQREEIERLRRELSERDNASSSSSSSARREKTVDELRAELKQNAGYGRGSKAKHDEINSFGLDKLKEMAADRKIPTEHNASPERKMSAQEQSVHNLNEWKKKQAEADRIKTRRDEEYGAQNERPSQGVHIKHNNMLDQLRKEVRDKNKRKKRNEPEPAPQGIKKSILKSLGSKPKGSLLETINSIRSNPEEVYRERTRAVTFGKNSEGMSSRDRIKFDRDRQKIDTGMWNKPSKPYPEIPTEELPNSKPEKGKRKGYIDKDMKIPGAVDATQTMHGPLWGQQMGKGIAEATIDLMSQPYQPYTKPSVAELSDGEQKARQMALYNSPFANEKLQNEENDIEDRIIDAGEMPGAADAASPYMKAFDQNPADMFEELLGPQERAQLKSIREESDSNLYDKLLPELRRKYLVPGMKRSGHLNRETGDIIEKYSKGRDHAINQAMTQNRLGALGVAQKHVSLQGSAAQQAAENSKSDVQRKMKTTDMLSLAKTQRYDTRQNFIKDEERRGMIDRDLYQRKMNEDQARYIEAREHPTKQLAFGATINRGLDVKPFVQQSVVRDLRQNPNAVNPNLFQNVGGGLRSLASDRMPKKKGGIIKSRCKKADGGQIMQEAVKNAVIDKDDPLTALRRLMNRQRMMDVSESNIGRRRYRDGGSVNPIQAGASQARQLLGEKDLRAHIASQKTPYEKPTGTSMIDAFMRGFESRETGGGAYTRSADIRDKTGKDNRAQQDKAFRDTYALDQNVKKEEAALRKEAREEKKMLADVAYRNAHLAQTGAYQAAKLKKGEKALSDVKKDALKLELKEKLDKAIYKRDTALNLNAATKGIDTGRWVGGAAKIPYIGHGVASALTGFSSSPMELQAADDASEEFFSARKPTQGRETNIQTADRRKAKAGLDKGEKFNSNQTRNLAQTDQSEVNAILAEYAKYADPDELKDYVNQYKDPKELADSLNSKTSKKVEDPAINNELSLMEEALAAKRAGKSKS